MAALKKLNSIPTLSQLYRAGKVPASSQADLPTANQTLNDKICTVQYDLTKLDVDAIVNAANSRLLGGGGVDGAIHRAAGPGLYNECKTLGGCKTGSAKITAAYNLPCKKVIHAVGPVYDNPQESEPLLKGCYRNSLQLAVENDCRSIAFSAISTGIYSYPSDEAAIVALKEVRKFLEKADGKKIDKVIFCNFMQKDVEAYNHFLPHVFPATADDRTSKDDSVKDGTNGPEIEISEDANISSCKIEAEKAHKDLVMLSEEQQIQNMAKSARMPTNKNVGAGANKVSSGSGLTASRNIEPDREPEHEDSLFADLTGPHADNLNIQNKRQTWTFPPIENDSSEASTGNEFPPTQPHAEDHPDKEQAPVQRQVSSPSLDRSNEIETDRINDQVHNCIHDSRNVLVRSISPTRENCTRMSDKWGRKLGERQEVERHCRQARTTYSGKVAITTDGIETR